MAIIFKTKGLLDQKAVTTFGMNAKPKTETPFGFFGTGLKYAIAILVRHNIPVSFWIGNKEYVFYAKDIDFREKQFHQVMMKQRNSIIGRWTYKELPFTTELGKHWQLWQAFRELYANTQDENGETFSGIVSGGDPEYTYIVVDSQEFEDIFHERSKVFLPGGLRFKEGNQSIQIFEESSQYLYYRGVRVVDLKKPSLYTYNVLSKQELTEDRTFKYSWEVSRTIASYIVTSTDAKFISRIINADGDACYEGELDFDMVWAPPSNVFHEIMRKKNIRKTSYSILPRISTYYQKYDPPPEIPNEQKLWYRLDAFGKRLNSAWEAGELDAHIQNGVFLDDDLSILVETVAYLKGRNE